jgi:hypothetical protein
MRALRKLKQSVEESLADLYGDGQLPLQPPKVKASLHFGVDSRDAFGVGLLPNREVKVHRAEVLAPIVFNPQFRPQGDALGHGTLKHLQRAGLFRRWLGGHRKERWALQVAHAHVMVGHRL